MEKFTKGKSGDHMSSVQNPSFHRDWLISRYFIVIQEPGNGIQWDFWGFPQMGIRQNGWFIVEKSY